MRPEFSETKRSETHEGSDLACLSKPGERHDWWRRWRTSVLPKVCVARGGLSLSFLWSARELSDSGRLAWQRSRRSAPIADRENRRRRLGRRLGQNVEAREKFRGLKRRCKNSRFRYATEQEDCLWFHPPRRWF